MQTVFKRKEIKYLITTEQYDSFLRDVMPFIKKDKYFDTAVSSIYFDTNTDVLIRRSIEKPSVYKEKLRLRFYGEPTDCTIAFAEIKKKYKGIVYKRRVVLDREEAETFLLNGCLPKDGSQIVNEIDYMMRYYGGLMPKMAIYYKRKAYVGKENENLRITFDSDVLWRRDLLDLKHTIYGERLLNDGAVILEIKCVGAMPLWLTSVLHKHKIYPTGYSKYGRAYITNLQKGLITYD